MGKRRNTPQSKRFAKPEDHGTSRQRLECAASPRFLPTQTVLTGFNHALGCPNLRSLPPEISTMLWAMNTASQNFQHHLGVLRERMLHPTDFEKAVHYFLDEFAGDEEFVRASDPEKMPHLVALLSSVVSKAIGRKLELEDPLVSYLRAHRFVHGNARADGRIVLFFYFQDADTGMVMLIPGVRGEGDVLRFGMPGGLPDPQQN